MGVSHHILSSLEKSGIAACVSMALMFSAGGTALAEDNATSEPNDDFEHANSIAVNTDVTETFESETDKDCYKFTIDKPGQITLDYSTHVWTFNPSWSINIGVYHAKDDINQWIFGYSYSKIINSTSISISSGGSETGHLDSPGLYYACLTGSPIGLDHTLNIGYEEDTYTVKFIPGNGETSSSQELSYNERASAPLNPTRSGYVFQGWYTDPDEGSAWDFTQPVTQSMTLYAHWKANTYTVAFDANGGRTPTASKTVTYDAPYGELPTATLAGHTFAGWYTAKDGGTLIDSSSTYTSARNTTLYAHWAVASYEVSFDPAGGSTVPMQSVKHGSKAIKPSDPTRSGYVFQGWYTAVDGGSAYDFKKAVTSNITLYAHWKKAPIKFNDVNSQTPHAEDIQWLADNEITTGYQEANGSRSYHGMGTVVRQDMAAFLRREAKLRNISDANTWKPSAADWSRFNDVNRDTPHAEDILWLAHAGITTGYSDGGYHGMGTVVRQDMAAFLNRLAKLANKSGGVTPKMDFTDVNDKTPHASEIRWLGGSGISQGYRNGNGSWRYEGMTAVYRQDMAAFIHRLDDKLK